MIEATLLDDDRALLMELLRTPTAGPLETGPGGPAPRLWDAQQAYADAATPLGFGTVHHAAAQPKEVLSEKVPLAVARGIEEIPGFLDDQPSLVLRLGPPLPQRDTVMFNAHLDTVSPLEPAHFDGIAFHGRGAVDAKGPAVALLAGIRAACAVEPEIGATVGVLVQAVSGEEGGAMGTTGTRPLVRRGFVGRLNLFCEPTGLRYLPRSSCAATARVWIEGRDAVDDRPACGHNATVLLGFLAQHIGLALAGQSDPGVCIAGLHTGRMHNRVYGTGELLVNMPYASAAAERQRVSTLEAALGDGLAAFTRTFSSAPEFTTTASDAASITRFEWIKRGLPTLASSDPWAEALLQFGAGLVPWPNDEPGFTCDAIWMHDVSDAFAAILGPGDLARNNAHASGEFVGLADLEQFASAVARVLVAFARHRPTNGTATP